MKKNIFLGFILLGAISFVGCENNDPMSKEQYEKIVYVVGASQNVISRELSYSTIAQETFASVAISGTHLISNDLKVSLSSHNSVINWYNTKYKYLDSDIRYKLLPGESYSIPSYSTTIKAGEVYARIPLSITTDGLHCDSLYALTFAIESVSDYSYNQTDSALIMTFSFVNEYSGTYLFSGSRNTLDSNETITSTTSMSYNRTFTATNTNTVRLFNEQQAEIISNIRDHCLTLTVSNGNVTVSAWEDIDIRNAACTYDSENKEFAINYTYKLNDQLYQFIGKFTKQKQSE